MRLDKCVEEYMLDEDIEEYFQSILPGGFANCTQISLYAEFRMSFKNRTLRKDLPFERTPCNQ